MDSKSWHIWIVSGTIFCFVLCVFMNWAWENVLCCYFVQREELYPYSSKYWVLLQIICRASLRFNRDCKEYKCDFFVIHDLEKNILVKIDIVLKMLWLEKKQLLLNVYYATEFKIIYNIFLSYEIVDRL